MVKQYFACSFTSCRYVDYFMYTWRLASSFNHITVRILVFKEQGELQQDSIFTAWEDYHTHEFKGDAVGCAQLE